MATTKQNRNRSLAISLQVAKIVCSIFAFYAATAIASSTQTLSALHNSNSPDGANPQSSLVLGNDGNFYGTTSNGGISQPRCTFNGVVECGTVFRITPGGTLTTLYNFCSQPNCADGWGPQAALVQGPDGNLYGTTDLAGPAIATRWLWHGLQNHSGRHADDAV